MAETKNLPALQQKAISLRDYLNKDSIKGSLELALPKWMSIDRLLRIVFTSTMKNPKLLDCTIESLLQSVMQCAQLGLEPILGRAYLIPYKNKKLVAGKWTTVLECQFQPGYQGLVDLGRRSGQVKDVFAMVVYENDEFDLEYGTSRHLTHKPCLTEDPGKAIGAYTVWELSDGTKTFEFMPLHELYKRRAKSQAYQYAIASPKNEKAQECPWVQWPEEQMKKTVVKHHSKLQPASIEYMQAVELDNATDLGRSQIGMFSQDPSFAALEAPPEPHDDLKDKIKNGTPGAAKDLYGSRDEQGATPPDADPGKQDEETPQSTDKPLFEIIGGMKTVGFTAHLEKTFPDGTREPWGVLEQSVKTAIQQKHMNLWKKAFDPDNPLACVVKKPETSEPGSTPNGYTFCPTGGPYEGKQVSYAAACGGCAQNGKCQEFQLYLETQKSQGETLE